MTRSQGCTDVPGIPTVPTPGMFYWRSLAASLCRDISARPAKFRHQPKHYISQTEHLRCNNIKPGPQIVSANTSVHFRPFFRRRSAECQMLRAGQIRHSTKKGSIVKLSRSLRVILSGFEPQFVWQRPTTPLHATSCPNLTEQRVLTKRGFNNINSSIYINHPSHPGTSRLTAQPERK